MLKDDDQPSCSAAEALTRQEPFINQNLAYQALGMLTQLLRHGSVSYQGGFCNLVDRAGCAHADMRRSFLVVHLTALDKICRPKGSPLNHGMRVNAVKFGA